MARAWAMSGRGSGKAAADVRSDADLWNLRSEDVERFSKPRSPRPAPDQVTVWRENWIAVQVFFDLHWEAEAGMHGLVWTGVPAQEIRQVFEDQRWPRFAWRRFKVPDAVKLMVREARQILNER